ncbi:hypothetical protein [Sphingomonas sp. NFR15]|uniref:hypothetical protein n=1 Tax=Sphingomonas sp. NFR15 TaxID=1566282 RepID=UPI00088B41FA|nr:hypothetical protein [Sphingomonas sp. NFR15]SDA14805.1 hypothetical protein SAMN03159340_00597 [Sphingomonas sp. NFR15]
MGDYSKQRMQVNNAQDLRFDGQLIQEYSTQNRDGTKDRWTEIRLWETEGGSWIVEQVGCSKRAGESNLRDALVFEEVRNEFEESVSDAEAKDYQRELHEKVMTFLGWTAVAKAFAKQAGWEVVRHVP